VKKYQSLLGTSLKGGEPKVSRRSYDQGGAAPKDLLKKPKKRTKGPNPWSGGKRNTRSALNSRTESPGEGKHRSGSEERKPTTKARRNGDRKLRKHGGKPGTSAF